MFKKASLRTKFIIRIIIILLAITLLSGIALSVLQQIGGMEFRPPGFMATIVLYGILIFIGTIFLIINFDVLIKPITDMRDAMKRIASGDFDIHIDSKSPPEIQELIRDFNQMAHDLNSIETLRSDFITNISHEIKTPIASIAGCVDLLQNGDLNAEESAEYIQLIATSTQRLTTLTNNMLQLSALEHEERLPEPMQFSLDEQLRQAILHLEASWTEKEVEFDLDLPAITICNHPDLLMEVWSNLLENAIKYSHQGGLITVQLKQDNKKVTVKIIDQGIGMEEQVSQHIFDKFYQGKTTRSEMGYGLGLAITKRILELCHGETDVKTEPGKGSVFTVTLPLA